MGLGLGYPCCAPCKGLPETLSIRFSNSGSCSILDGVTATLTGSLNCGVYDNWTATETSGSCTAVITLASKRSICTGPNCQGYQLRIDFDDAGGGHSHTSTACAEAGCHCSCLNLNLVFHIDGPNFSCDGNCDSGTALTALVECGECTCSCLIADGCTPYFEIQLGTIGTGSDSSCCSNPNGFLAGLRDYGATTLFLRTPVAGECCMWFATLCDQCSTGFASAGLGVVPDMTWTIGVFPCISFWTGNDYRNVDAEVGPFYYLEIAHFTVSNPDGSDVPDYLAVYRVLQSSMNCSASTTTFDLMDPPTSAGCDWPSTFTLSIGGAPVTSCIPNTGGFTVVFESVYDSFCLSCYQRCAFSGRSTSGPDIWGTLALDVSTSTWYLVLGTAFNPVTGEGATPPAAIYTCADGAFNPSGASVFDKLPSSLDPSFPASLAVEYDADCVDVTPTGPCCGWSDDVPGPPLFLEVNSTPAGCDTGCAPEVVTSTIIELEWQKASPIPSTTGNYWQGRTGIGCSSGGTSAVFIFTLKCV